MDFPAQVLGFISKTYPRIERDARLVGKQFPWRGRYKFGDTVARGTAVMYVDKVFVALTTTRKEPAELSPDWGFLCNLRNMRVTDDGQDSWFNVNIPVISKESPELAIVSTMAKRLVERRLEYILHKPVAGAHKWRGIYRWGKSYSEGDFVAYNHGLWLATPGDGVPGGYSEGWSIMDFVAGMGTTESDPLGPNGAAIFDINKKEIIVSYPTFLTGTVPADGWTYSINGGPDQLPFSTLVGNEVHIPLAEDVKCGDVITVDYDPYAGDMAVGGDHVDLAASAVTHLHVANGVSSPKPVIDVDLVDSIVMAGDEAIFPIVATHATSYRWYFDDRLLAETGDILTIAHASSSDVGRYRCEIINGCGIIKSAEVRLSVTALPTAETADSILETADSSTVTADITP